MYFFANGMTRQFKLDNLKNHVSLLDDIQCVICIYVHFNTIELENHEGIHFECDRKIKQHHQRNDLRNENTRL